MRKRTKAVEMIGRNGVSPLLGTRIPLAALVQVIAVAEHLNFRHAANSLGVSQSHISGRMKALEEDLGVILFERHPRGVRLTEAGRLFVDEVERGVAQIDHAIKIAGAIASSETGCLRIGFQSLPATSFLTELRRRYKSLYPGIRLIVSEGSSAETLRQLRESNLDLAIIFGAADQQDCHSKPLWSEKLVVALPELHPLAQKPNITWTDLVLQTFLVPTQGCGPYMQGHIVRRVSEADCSPRICRCHAERDTLMLMVAEGDGIALATEAVARIQFPGIVFRPIGDETEDIRFSAVWSPHNRAPALKNLLDLATQMSRSARPA